MSDDFVLNEHNKDEFPPAHTAEHLLNQTMIRLFGCERSYNAHIERKKSKMSFYLDRKSRPQALPSGGEGDRARDAASYR